MTSPLDGKVVPFGQAVDTLHEFLNAPAGDIETVAGPLPNLHKLAAEMKSEAADAVDRSIGDFNDAAALVDQRAIQVAQDAAIASAARDAAIASAKLYSTKGAAEGDAALAIGSGYVAPLPDGSLQAYRKDSSASSTPLGAPFASKAAVVAADQRTIATRGFLANGGMLRNTGAGRFHPFVVDLNNRVLFGYDTLTKGLFGIGLVSKSTLPPAVKGIFGSFNQANYHGSTAAIIPLVSDAYNRALLWWDVAAKKWKGPGLADGGGGSAATPLNYSPLSSLAQKPVAKALNHLLFYGQSLSVGATAIPVISTTQPYQNKTFTSGPRAAGNDFSGLKPLVEDALPAPDGASNRGETVCSGAANYATMLAAIDGRSPGDHIILASTAGHGSYRIDQLNKASAWYPTLLAHVSGAHVLSADHAVHAVGWIQGENDAVSGTRTPYAVYRAALEQLQVDIDTDIRAITGQAAPVYLLTYQMSYGARVWPAQANAQLDLARKNPRFVMVTPTYHLPHAPDNVHLTAIGYKRLGAYFGKAYKTMVIDGKRPKWIEPISATRRGKVIRVRFDVPVGPLVLDTATMAPTANFGFKVLDEAGTPTISSIAVDGNDLLVTLSALPTGEAWFRAGMDYLGAGLTITEGASTNLRDSDPSVINIGSTSYPLYNVCPHFQMPVLSLGE